MGNLRKEQMTKVIADIELTIAEQLAEGKEPTVLIGNNRTIEDIQVAFFGNQEVDWSKGVAFTFGLTAGDVDKEGIILVVYRTIDLDYGQVVVV